MQLIAEPILVCVLRGLARLCCRKQATQHEVDKKSQAGVIGSWKLCPIAGILTNHSGNRTTCAFFTTFQALVCTLVVAYLVSFWSLVTPDEMRANKTAELIMTMIGFLAIRRPSWSNTFSNEPLMALLNRLIQPVCDALPILVDNGVGE